MPTVTELIAEIRAMLDEPNEAQWTQTNLRTWINEGNRDLARATRHLKATETIPTVAGTGTYNTSDSVIAIEHAYYEDVAGVRRIPLIPKHFENMDSVRGYNWDREGTPQYFTTLGFNPSLQVSVFPVPTVEDDNLILMIAKLPAAIDLTGAGDASQVETAAIWYDALSDYCEFKGLRKDRDPRWQEAYELYKEKRDGLINNPDYLAVNRELIPDPIAGYQPEWLVSFD